jgi:hypothetical protein
MDTRARLDWPQILGVARRVVAGYTTGVTVRQLYYRLVASQVLLNNMIMYKTSSRPTAEARRRREFPRLPDLCQLYTDALSVCWDTSTYEDVLAAERDASHLLRHVADATARRNRT